MVYISGTTVIRQQAIFRDRDGLFHHAGSLHDFLLSAYDAGRYEYPKFYKMDNLCKLGFLAASVLLDALPIRHYPPEAVAIVLSNAHASLDTDRRYLASTRTTPSPALFVYTLPNIVAGELSIRYGLKGENAFFVTPSFDPAWIAGSVNQVMAQPHVKACLAGWIDVMDEGHDVFLYLAEKEPRGVALPHTAEELAKLYQFEYGKVDGGS